MAEHDNSGSSDVPLRWDDTSSGRYEIVRRPSRGGVSSDLARLAPTPERPQTQDLTINALLGQMQDQLERMSVGIEQRVAAAEKRLSERDLLMSEILNQLRSIHVILARQEALLRAQAERPQPSGAKPPPPPPPTWPGSGER